MKSSFKCKLRQFAMKMPKRRITRKRQRFLLRNYNQHNAIYAWRRVDISARVIAIVVPTFCYIMANMCAKYLCLPRFLWWMFNKNVFHCFPAACTRKPLFYWQREKRASIPRQNMCQCDLFWENDYHLWWCNCQYLCGVGLTAFNYHPLIQILDFVCHEIQTLVLTINAA